MAKTGKKLKKSALPDTWLGVPAEKLGLLIAATGMVIYLQTITFQYTQDDAIVINENMFTTQGMKGIPGLFKYDTFYGYFKDLSKTKLVSGGRYRPLTPAMFAVEYDIAGLKPWFSHFMNALYYGLLCWLLFGFLRELLTPRLTGPVALQIAAIGTLIFAFHPIHTEVVANIKGRDEIIAAIGAIGGLWLMLKASRDVQPLFYQGAALIVFLAGMLAKENVITMLAVAPLTLWWFQKNTNVQWLKNLWPVITASVLFLLIRGSVIGWSLGDTPTELMNNPFLKVENGNYMPFTWSEKMATVTYTMGKYLQLLIFPYPLTHDYYPRHVDIQDWSKPYVWLTLLAGLGLATVVFKGWKNRSWWAYGILFYVCTMSITSNLVFPVGTNMSERFAFLPSVGFALVAGYGFHLLLTTRYKKAILVVLLAMLAGYVTWTLARSRAWKDNTTLFTTDIHTSKRSAKLLNASGGDLISRAEDETDPVKKHEMLIEAQGYLKRAQEIHPNYKLSYLLLGNSYFHLKDLDNAILYFRHVLKMDPSYQEGRKNLGVALRDKGKEEGEKNRNLEAAITLLQEAVQYLPTDYETYQLLGVAYGQKGDTQKAIEYFKKEIELAPKNATAHYNLGVAYRHAGDMQAAQASFDAAKALDPNLPQLKNQ